MTNLKLNKNWTTSNNNHHLNSKEVESYISVVPNENQLKHSKKPFYAFIHFGMNTATQREWGSGKEECKDFTITSINAKQWISTIKASGATGVILTCKHHDGFCLWESEYTDFSVKNTDFGGDIVKMVSDECRSQNMDFGVYLSPWDMHDKRYGTDAYNDYFCNQLTELLTDYGDIFEVWFDGAKGKDAVSFEYDWMRYFKLIRALQPNANIAICGPDIRWVGNEGGKCRKNEYSVVPSSLTKTEGVEKNSQSSEKDAESLKKFSSTDEDLGSRKVLKRSKGLCWYPAEVDVSIRKGWFHSDDENKTVKSAKKLFKIYLNSVGNNCYLLLNVPPSRMGEIYKKDVSQLKKLGELIAGIEKKPALVKSIGKLSDDDGYLEFTFDSAKKLRYAVISEDISHSQRVEAFDLYLRKPNGKYIKVYSGTIIGNKKIIKIKNKKCIGALLVIRQSRSTPYIEKIGFYE